MKRDFNLIRKILLDIEKSPPGKTISKLHYENYDEEVVKEHIRLLMNAKIIEGEIKISDEVIGCCNQQMIIWYEIKRLTWEGHNFLNNAKNDTVWKKVMADAENKGMSLSMSVLNGLLTKAVEKYMGLA